jgi:hypothetical protein
MRCPANFDFQMQCKNLIFLVAFSIIPENMRGSLDFFLESAENFLETPTNIFPPIEYLGLCCVIVRKSTLNGTSISSELIVLLERLGRAEKGKSGSRNFQALRDYRSYKCDVELLHNDRSSMRLR